MLKAFRDNLKSLTWVLWAVIAAFILTIFAVWGGGVQEGGAPNSAVASIGETEISEREFRRAYQRVEAAMRAQWGPSYTPELARQAGIAQQAVDSLVVEKILLAEADRLGLEATQAEVRDVILGIPGFTDGNGVFIGQEAYQDALLRGLSLGGVSVRYTVREFEDEISRQVLVQKLQDVITQSVHVSDSEIEESFRDEVEKARISYLSLSPELFAEGVSIEETELQAFFDENAEDYELPERRRADYAMIEPALLRTEIEIGDEEIRGYYDSNTEEFTTEDRAQARHILLVAEDDSQLAEKRATLEDFKRRIQAGEDFAALARGHSEDDATRDVGGDLGFFSRGRYNPALEDAAFGAAAGALVGPIESALLSGTGLHLMEVQSVVSGGLQAYEEVEAAIRSRLLGERSRSRAESLASELANKIEDDGSGVDGLRSWADDNVAARFASTELFAEDDNVPGIGRGTALTATTFSLEVGETSDALEVPGGWIVLHTAQIDEARPAGLEEVRPELEAALREEKQGELAAAKLDQALADVRGGRTLAEVARELDAELIESEEFGRDGFVPELGFELALTEAVFEQVPGDLGGPVATSLGPVIWQVSERTEADPVELASRRPEIRERLTTEKMGTLLSSIISRRRNEEGVSLYTERLEALGVG